MKGLFIVAENPSSGSYRQLTGARSSSHLTPTKAPGEVGRAGGEGYNAVVSLVQWLNIFLYLASNDNVCLLKAVKLSVLGLDFYILLLSCLFNDSR